MILRATVDPGAFNPEAVLYIQSVLPEDFRHNPRGELGTRTATLHKLGLLKMRTNWVYLLPPG